MDIRFDITTAADRPTGSDSKVPTDASGADTGHRRASAVQIAIAIDELAVRCDEEGLPFVAYLLRVARAALGETLGERPPRRVR